MPEPGVPESFKVLIKELQSLALDIKVLDGDGNEVVLSENDDDEPEALPVNIAGLESSDEDEEPKPEADQEPSDGESDDEEVYEESEEENELFNILTGEDDDYLTGSEEPEDTVSIEAMSEAEDFDDDDLNLD